MNHKSVTTKFCLFLLVLIIGFLSASPVWADTSDNAIQIKSDCSQVKIQDAPLPEVAQAFNLLSGIEIRLPGGLIGEFITDQLSAKDCSSAVLGLLQDFSMMKFWGDDGGLIAVQLLSRKQAWAPETTPEVTSVSLVSNSVKQEEPRIRMAKELDQDQLQTLIDVGKGKISPWEVINDPAYKPFLLQTGLMDSASWEDKKRLKNLRNQALRAWMKQNRASKAR